MARPQDLLVLAVFLATAVLLSQLLGRTRAALSAAQQREHEALRLYEFSTALAGQHTDQSIARTIAQYAVETFQADRVEVVVEASGDQAASSVCLPPDQSPVPDRPPAAIAPLLTARGLQGEIRVWLDRAVLTPAEDRLLKTFATQGALALERSRLARSEARAHVAEESDRLKTALLSSVSHELRTPLATIKAAVTSLRSGTVDRQSTARDELLATIEEETDQLNTLVGNLLDMSRIEAGALKPQRAWNDLEEIIGAALARLKQAARHHRLEIAVPDDLPLVPVDFVQIQQVFINLISNGLKYAPEGTTVRVEAKRRDREYSGGARDQPRAARTGRTSRSHLRQVLSGHGRRSGDGHRPGAIDLQRNRRGARRTHLGRKPAGWIGVQLYAAAARERYAAAEGRAA